MIRGKIKIALGQIKIIWEDKDKNRANCETMVKRAAQANSDLIIFPELTLTGFTMNVNQIAEDAGDSPTILFFEELAKKYKINIIFGVALKLKDGKKGRNMAIMVDTFGRARTQYQKIHPFSFAQEEKYYQPGDKLALFSIKGFKCALVICYDLRFPGLFEALAKHRPEAVIIIANWPKARIRHWQTLLAARSFDMQCNVIGVNRVGKGANLEYNGYSSAYSVTGEKIVEYKNKETLGFVELDKKTVSHQRRAFTSLRDKRHYLYPLL
ncbi:MAG: nitrilase-related carbon-nitrogen hydrolase [Patescibacteria group bacterium]